VLAGHDLRFAAPVHRAGRARQFGADVLGLVLKRAPRGELAKSARNKLKLAGVA
jgi:hypothetical protein